jgi:hypothetical protein
MIRVVFDHIILDLAPLGAAFGTGLDIDVRHFHFLRCY